MKSIKQLTACAALVALTGCNPNSPSSNEKPPETAAPTGAMTELPNTPAVTALNKESAPVPPPAAVVADKSGFIASTEEKLKDFDTKIDELAKKAEDYKDDAKAQAEQTLAALREQRSKLSEQFENLKRSSAEAWTQVKAGFESALSELEKAYENAKSKFS